MSAKQQARQLSGRSEVAGQPAAGGRAFLVYTRTSAMASHMRSSRPSIFRLLNALHGMEWGMRAIMSTCAAQSLVNGSLQGICDPIGMSCTKAVHLQAEPHVNSTVPMN